jgi:hypothetical protein
VQQESVIIVESPPDTLTQHANIRINMNITMLHLPCAATSVDAEDVMGNHLLDVGGELHKTRVDNDGNVLPGKKFDAPAKEQVGEGCNVHGYMVVRKVPGNFHVSAHAHSELIAVYFPGSTIDTSHIVHDLSFGDPASAKQLNLIDSSVVNPLAGASKKAEFSSKEHAPSYEYYINVVPTDYLRLSGELIESFQFSANSNEIVGRYRIPALYFRYELSAVTVVFKDKAGTFSHFIVEVCAIVGGIFTALGLLNSVILTTTKRFKGNINKLG